MRQPRLARRLVERAHRIEEVADDDGDLPRGRTKARRPLSRTRSNTGKSPTRGAEGRPLNRRAMSVLPLDHLMIRGRPGAPRRPPLESSDQHPGRGATPARMTRRHCPVQLFYHRAAVRFRIDRDQLGDFAWFWNHAGSFRKNRQTNACLQVANHYKFLFFMQNDPVPAGSSSYWQWQGSREPRDHDGPWSVPLPSCPGSRSWASLSRLYQLQSRR